MDTIIAVASRFSGRMNDDDHARAQRKSATMLITVDTGDDFSRVTRRCFRSKRKLNNPGLISHITQRSAGREPMFIEDDDYLRMLGLLKDIREKYGLNFYAFCAMPNHLHMLLSPEKPNLSDAMRDLFATYVNRFNRKFERKGHLVGSPFRQAIVLDDGYLLTASLYIHLNPVKGGIAENACDYPWSSAALYCRDDAPEAFIDPSFVLALLSTDAKVAKERYRVLIRNGGGLPAEQVLEQEDAIDRFRARLAGTFPKLFGMIGTQKNAAATKAGLDLLSQEALNEKVEEIRQSKKLGPPVSKEAKKYVVEQLIARGYKRSEIATRMNVSRKTVYNWLQAEK